MENCENRYKHRLRTYQDGKTGEMFLTQPHDLDINLRVNTCQKAVTAVRKAGATSQIILLPGRNFTIAETFVMMGRADALHAIKNPDAEMLITATQQMFIEQASTKSASYSRKMNNDSGTARKAASLNGVIGFALAILVYACL